MKYFIIKSLCCFLLFDLILAQSVKYSPEELKLLESWREKNSLEHSTKLNSISRLEKIEQIGSSLDFKKILFYKQTTIKQKTLKELILFLGNEKTLQRYFFENTKNYRKKKKEIVNEHGVILASFDPYITRSEVIAPPEIYLKILVKIQKDERSFYRVDFFLGESRTKYILGSVELENVLYLPPIVERVFFFDEGKIIIPIIRYKYLKNNQYVIKEKLLAFYLDHQTLQKKRLVISKENFIIPLQEKLNPFLTESYFDFRNTKVLQIDLLLNGKRVIKQSTYSPLLTILSRF